MGNRAYKPCKRTGCTALTRSGWCDKHKPDWRTKERKESNNWHWLYRTKWWKSTREKMLLINPWCVECAKHELRVRATDVDHVVPHRGNRGRFFDENNLETLCHRCHSRKTMREQNERRSGGQPPHPTKI